VLVSQHMSEREAFESAVNAKLQNPTSVVTYVQSSTVRITLKNVPTPAPVPVPAPIPIPIPVPVPTPTPVPDPTPNPIPDPKPIPNPSPIPNRRLFETSDFVYEGTYVGWDGDSNYAQGLTHRYVDGQFRLCYLDYLGAGANTGFWGLTEITLAPDFSQQTRCPKVTEPTFYTDWQPGWNNQNAHLSLWWEEQEQRFWTTSAADYPQGELTNDGTPSIYTRQLPLSGGGLCRNHSGFSAWKTLASEHSLEKYKRFQRGFRPSTTSDPTSI